MFSGCYNPKKESIKIEKDNNISVSNKTKEPNLDNEIPSESKSQEYTCWASGSLIKEDFYVSYISKNRNECNIGKSKIILKKVIGRKDNGQAIFEKLDEINVEKRNEKTAFSKVPLKISPKSKEQDYVIKFYDGRTETISKIYAIWKVDYGSMKFKKITIPKNLKFENPDWYGE